MNSVDDMTPDCLGYAGLVYEYVLVSLEKVKSCSSIITSSNKGRKLVLEYDCVLIEL